MTWCGPTTLPVPPLIDVPPGPRKRSYAGARIELRQFPDGGWRVYLGADVIATQAATPTPELRTLKQRRRRLSSAAWSGNNEAHTRVLTRRDSSSHPGTQSPSSTVDSSFLPCTQAMVLPRWRGEAPRQRERRV